jgi:CheY-like chemotaxis protein
LDYLPDYTTARNTPALASVWQSVSALSSVIAAESGSNRNPDAGPLSIPQSQIKGADSNRRRTILIVEDSRADAALIRMAMERACIDFDFVLADDGEKAIQFFVTASANSEAPCPDLVILDLNLPRHKGEEILQRLRNGTRCAQVPVIIVTTSASASDRENMYRLGAQDYFRKPSDFSEFMKLGQRARLVLGLDADGGTSS